MTLTTSITLRVPGQLRQYCDGLATIPVAASRVREALVEIEARYPNLYRGVCDDTGAIRRHVNLFVNTASVRDLEGLDSALAPGDVVTILPAVSGG